MVVSRDRTLFEEIEEALPDGKASLLRVRSTPALDRVLRGGDADRPVLLVDARGSRLRLARALESTAPHRADRRGLLVALVAHDAGDRAEAAVDLGFDDVLLMPAPQEELRLRLRLWRRRAAEPAAQEPSEEHSLAITCDSLTGLPMRSTLDEKLRIADSQARRDQRRIFALLLFDIDRFKNVNDSLGHLVGDGLLHQLAERVRRACRPGDLLVRFGGDEFVVLVEDIRDIRSAVSAAERLQRTFDEPFDLDGVEVFVTVSTGIAVWKPAYRSAQEIIRDADTAMYRAKSAGRNRFAVFDESMHAEVVQRLELETDLRKAVERSEFEPFYQPIVNLRGGTVAGFEVLARWRHPRRGLLLPGAFIPTAEEIGTVAQIDRAVAEEGCRQLRAWQTRFRRHPDLCLSVNISSTQFTHSDLVAQMDHILRKTGIWGRSLSVEVTESVLMEHAEHAEGMLAQLQALEIGITIDDFGTGYSSLAYLRRYGIDALKIDRSFVALMMESEDSSEIVRTIATLAGNLGKVSIAEGVESRAQLYALRRLGVDRIQGNLVASPLSAEAATELLARTEESRNHLQTILAMD